MLFDSYLFLFLFLPIALLGYYLIAKLKNPRFAIIWLVAVSLFFCAWANPVYLAPIIGSVLFNYTIGVTLARPASKERRKLIMVLAVAANILLLGYFKYTNFFISNINVLLATDIHILTIALPLAVSFYTLTQIAYLVDIYRGEVYGGGFWEYLLFVTFFPKLISGPIVRMKQFMPQLTECYKPRLNVTNIAIGLTSIFLGLFKKVILADHLGAYANPVFDAATLESGISFFNSWTGALAYTFQLYFDFSGYCDIAIGIGLMFSIRLPLNFYSPYKAKSIIDFWRRWHITLSRFIRDYIYIPLGGNRTDFLRQMVNLMVAMIIAGFWHGAGWTFIIWGALHGIYLVINHIWQRLKRVANCSDKNSTWWGSAVSILITFFAVVLAWVFFRSDSVSAAIEILKGMVGIYGFHIHFADYSAIGQLLGPIGIRFDYIPGFSSAAIIWILLSLYICWFLPNVQEYMSESQPALDSFPGENTTPRFTFFKWKPSVGNAIAIALVAVVAILSINQISKFIYFQF